MESQAILEVRDLRTLFSLRGGFFDRLRGRDAGSVKAVDGVGFTLRRGEVLGNFKKTYRQSDILVDTHGELPDYLPMVLEYAALVDLAAGRELLTRFRASLEMLRFGLLRDELPHARILQAVCATLPGKSPADEQAVMRMAGYGPPTEAVGLDPYDARLLPVKGA